MIQHALAFLLFILLNWKDLLFFFGGMSLICAALIAFGVLLDRWVK